MGPSPLRAAPNEVSLHRPLIPTQGQVQLSPSTGPSCPKRELQNEAVPTQGPGRDRYGLSPREEEEEEDGLAGCAAQEPELATRPREGFGGPKETRLPARPRCCRVSEAWLEPATAVLLYLVSGQRGWCVWQMLALQQDHATLLWQAWDWTCPGEELVTPLSSPLLSARGDGCPAGTGQVSALGSEHNYSGRGSWGGWLELTCSQS